MEKTAWEKATVHFILFSLTEVIRNAPEEDGFHGFKGARTHERDLRRSKVRAGMYVDPIGV